MRIQRTHLAGFLALAITACARGERASTAGSLAVTDDAGRRVTLPAPQCLVVVVWRNPPIVIGAGSYLDRLAGLAGARNVFHDIGSPSAQVSIETIAARDPDFIAVLADSTMRGPPRYAARPEWRVV